MRRCLLAFLSVLPLLVTGCKKGESNLTQSTASFLKSAVGSHQMSFLPGEEVSRVINDLSQRAFECRAKAAARPGALSARCASTWSRCKSLQPLRTDEIKYAR